ncbi:hypothetical protein PCANC_03736 [Puccinia coronata f. sp. avenae]|uniref:Uncharacterized protein n=1 Tax=Puccinia coronata f. sp. avenae TaxID=200324 RepID=A0A2N5S3T5_9BASI|nr:hypothetical protein PCASD_20340 [Puccinia coronata f. sp. avenae]PLW29169.1 hypothetical protein PCASD_10933 [Puccinia coronata f. sp. avenae]PLW53955.1 hypothetical protein PCANC_03736 [Puccinia coronata f. sp. avenae]
MTQNPVPIGCLYSRRRTLSRPLDTIADSSQIKEDENYRLQRWFCRRYQTRHGKRKAKADSGEGGSSPGTIDSAFPRSPGGKREAPNDREDGNAVPVGRKSRANSTKTTLKKSPSSTQDYNKTKHSSVNHNPLPPQSLRTHHVVPQTPLHNNHGQTHPAAAQANSTAILKTHTLLALKTYQQLQSSHPSTLQAKTHKNYKQIFIASAGLVGSLVLLDGFLNRDQRIEPLSKSQKELLNSSFQHTGMGLAITSVLARYMFKNGLTMRMMAMNPLVVAGVGLAGSIGSMMCTLNTSPDNTVPKYGFWLAFTACQAATLSPLYFFAPAVLSRAALYTVGVVGSLSYVGATAKNDRFLYLGGPLLAGVSVVALSSLAPLVLPVTAARTLMVTESISLYGGLAVFSGFVLYDTQKILNHGLLVEQGRMKPDPVNESVGLIMDSINIFIRLVQILAMQSNKRK